MDRDTIMRRALTATVPFNLVAALMFAFPASLGQLAGLPVPVPSFYAAMLTLFVVLFAGAYAWLARQPVIDRPLVAFLAIGKASVFVLVLVWWMLGAASGLSVIAGAGDLAFAAIFFWWLSGGS